MIVNFLVVLGAVLYLSYSFSDLLHLPSRVVSIAHLAFDATVLLQILRGLAYHLNVKFIPQSLMLKGMDRKFVADTTVVLIIWFCILSSALPGNFESVVQNTKQISNVVLGFVLVLGSWLFRLSLLRSKIPTPVFVIVTLMMLTPCLAIAGSYYATAAFFKVTGDRDVEMLFVAVLIPALASFSAFVFHDNRDVLLNLKSMIIYMFVTLPAIPLCYMLLQLILPQNVNPLFLAAAVAICFVAPVTYWRTRRRPWRARERAAELLRTAPTRDLREVQAEVQAILQELVSKNLVVRDAIDHIDRAHTYKLLGDLQVKLMQFIDAEKNYQAAVDGYNDALKLEADNQTAISSKFHTVESIREIQRTRF